MKTLEETRKCLMKWFEEETKALNEGKCLVYNIGYKGSNYKINK